MGLINPFWWTWIGCQGEHSDIEILLVLMAYSGVREQRDGHQYMQDTAVGAPAIVGRRGE